MKKSEKPLYNIVLGQGTLTGQLTAYEKVLAGDEYEINCQAYINGWQRDDFAFTQEEIDDLKSRLPENMGKIIDAAKVKINK